MLADVLEGLRGRFVEELDRRAAMREWPSLPDAGRRSRLDELIRQVIESLRNGAPGDGVSAAGPAGIDPEVALAEHALVERFLIDEIQRRSLAVGPSDRAIVDGWRRYADFQSLREQNRRLNSLLDDVHESAAVLGPDGRVLYVNRRAAHALREAARLPRHELLGKTLDELGVPMELFVGRPVSDLVGMAKAHETLETMAWGRAREAQFEAIYGADGAVGAVGMLVRDVHNRKISAVRIELLSKLGALVGLDYDEVAEGLAGVPVPELADWCAFNVVEDGRIVRTFIANGDSSLDRLRDDLGRAVPAWDGHPLWQEMLTGGFQLLSEVTDDLVRKLAVSPEQYSLLAKLGVRSAMIVPLVLRAQTTGIMTFVYTNESGRRYGGDDPALAAELALHAARALENARLMKDLRASEARFRVALAGARTVVFEQDAALRYTWYYNPIAGTCHDKTPEEAAPPEEAAALERTKRRVLEEGEGVNEEVDLTLGSKGQRHYREAIEPVRDHTGKVVGLIGAATDITEQQHMKQELSDGISFRERMMGILSHDLRNPLNAITMGTDLLLRREGLPDTAASQVKRIRRAAGRMREMIETLLDFTRLRYCTFPVTFAQADLGAIAHAVVEEARAAHPDLRIDLEVSGDTAGEWDQARIAQALSNLIANAAAYGDVGCAVSVSVRGDAEGEVVSVNNRGAPIPADLLPLVFEPFRRGVSGDRSPQGLGLGLYVVQQIVIAHGGRIDVQSSEEAGTTFTMRLPRLSGTRHAVAAAG